MAGTGRTKEQEAQSIPTNRGKTQLTSHDVRVALMQTICLLLSVSVFIILWLAGWGLDAETPFVAVAELPVESMAGDVDVATITVIALHTDITMTGGTTALAKR